MHVDELQREVGLGIDGIVTGRKLMGIETPLLADIAPEPTWEHIPAE